MDTIHVYYDEYSRKDLAMSFIADAEEAGFAVISALRKHGIHRKYKHRLTTLPQVFVVRDGVTIIKHNVTAAGDLDFEKLFSEGGSLSQTARDAAYNRICGIKQAKVKEQKNRDDGKKALKSIIDMLEGETMLSNEDIKKILKALTEHIVKGYTTEKFSD